jgi:quinol monooxygenase YgiN
MYGLFGKMRAHHGQRDALIAHLMQGVKHLQELDGCYLYVINSDPNDPDAIWVNEVWRSQADHQASLAHEGVRAVITAARPLIAEIGGERFEVTPLGGKGIPNN